MRRLRSEYEGSLELVVIKKQWLTSCIQVVAARELDVEANLYSFVCATSKQTSETVALTSYKSPHTRNDLLNSVRIWEACRATSAASTFFDSVAIGRFAEEFVDGATGANNPVQELWSQAQSVWGPEPIGNKVQCIVSIGTGIPSLKPFREDILGIGSTLAAISTETEQTAERFQRDKLSLLGDGHYFRFNVIRGLEDIGLEESQKRKEIAAATGRYVKSSDVVNQMQLCAKSVAGVGLNKFNIPFSLKGVPVTRNFVDRHAEMQDLLETLLPADQTNCRKIFVLRGLGGIGKTQLAVKFMRDNHEKFSSVLWIDGSSEDSLKQSMARFANRIDQISNSTHADSGSKLGDLDAAVQKVLDWLAKPDNSKWLIVFDNVDREYSKSSLDPLAYDIGAFIPDADHGAILITTRLARLEQLGKSREIQKVGETTAKAILKSWYKHECDETEYSRILERLDGLPLAIAQAGAFLHENGTSIEEYLRLYESSYQEIAESSSEYEEGPLMDYPDRSIWTTWVISYNSILAKNPYAAHLLLLWSCLDNKDLWYGIFQELVGHSNDLLKWIGDIAGNEIAFNRAMKLLRSYSLVEGVEKTNGYSMHAVVHRWAYFCQGQKYEPELETLAVLIVGSAVPERLHPDSAYLQQRLLPHVQVCLQRFFESHLYNSQTLDIIYKAEKVGILEAFNNLGMFFAQVGKLDEAGKMYVRVLDMREKIYGKQHPRTAAAAYGLGTLYYSQGKLAEAEKLLSRALYGSAAIFGPTEHITLDDVTGILALYSRSALSGSPKHISLLEIANVLALTYKGQGNFSDAETLLIQVLHGREQAFGIDDPSVFMVLSNLGIVCAEQGRCEQAEKMLLRAVRGKEELLGKKHISTLDTMDRLGQAYASQEDKLAEAEKIWLQVLKGREEALGTKHISTLETMYHLGTLYAKQDDKLAEAEKVLQQVVQGREEVLGAKHPLTLHAIHWLGDVYFRQDRLAEAEKWFERAVQDFEEMDDLADKNHPSMSHAFGRLAYLYKKQDRLAEAEKMYLQELRIRTASTKDSFDDIYYLYLDLFHLYKAQRRPEEAEKIVLQILQHGQEIPDTKKAFVFDMLETLAIAYLGQGKIAEAEKVYLRTLQGREETLGAKNPTTLGTICKLGVFYEELDEENRAEEIFLRILQVSEKDFGSKNPMVIPCAHKLVQLYQMQGKHSDAVGTLQRIMMSEFEDLRI